MTNVGVHTSHCCSRHGCKYNSFERTGEECPVVSGEAVQEFPCEMCGWEQENLDDLLRHPTPAFRQWLASYTEELADKCVTPGSPGHDALKLHAGRLRSLTDDDPLI